MLYFYIIVLFLIMISLFNEVIAKVKEIRYSEEPWKYVSKAQFIYKACVGILLIIFCITRIISTVLS